MTDKVEETILSEEEESDTIKASQTTHPEMGISNFTNIDRRTTQDNKEGSKIDTDIYNPDNIENQLQQDDIMEAKGHDESQGIFLDKMVIQNQSRTSKDLIKTKRNTIISKNSFIKNPGNILASKIVISQRAIVRSDLCTIKIDAYSVVCDSVILKPPMSGFNNQYGTQFTSITIGKYTIIGPNTIVKANMIGNCVRIGKNCILEDNVMIEDNCIIEDNTILSENTLVPKNTIFGGKPGRFIRKVPFETQQNHIIEAIHYYQSILNLFPNQLSLMFNFNFSKNYNCYSHFRIYFRNFL